MHHRIYCSNFEVNIKSMLPFQNSSELHVAFYKKAIEIGSLSKMIFGCHGFEKPKVKAFWALTESLSNL